MEKNKKRLLITSIVICVLIVGLIIKAVLDAVLVGFEPSAEMIEEYKELNVSKDILRIILISAFVIGLLSIIPDAILAVKGLIGSQNGNITKGYATFAKVMMIIYIVSLVSTIITAATAKSPNIPSIVISCIVSAIYIPTYFFYNKTVKEIANSNSVNEEE